MNRKYYLPYLIFTLLLAIILLLQGGGFLTKGEPFIIVLTALTVLTWGLFLRKQKEHLIQRLQDQLNQCPLSLVDLAHLSRLPLATLLSFRKQPQTLRYQDLRALQRALNSVL